METKTYYISMRHDFIIKTNDIEKVLNNYEFPDFGNLLVDDPEFLDGHNTWEEIHNEDKN